MILRQTQSASYWTDTFVVEDFDLEFLYNLLLEAESPLTTDDLVLALIRSRIDREARALQHRNDGARLYLPKERYQAGQRLVFPALGFTSGEVIGVRPGSSPETGEFEVIQVDFGEGRPRREFAAGLLDHKLNTLPQTGGLDGSTVSATPENIGAEFGPGVATKLEARLLSAGEVVRLGGAWFPRQLLLDVHIGHLNVAEAVLDMAEGGPLPTEELSRHLELPASAGERLKNFSLDYALQEDNRFDEVGPAGKILWFLRRLEPPEVQYPPPRLALKNPTYDRAALTPELKALAIELDDEFHPNGGPAEPAEEVSLTLTFPHRRVGTLPITRRTAPLIPTALVAPRVRITLVDGDSGQRMPGWVVREGRYIFGLDEWYAQKDVPSGGIVRVQRGDSPGEVVVRASQRRPAREWVRTVVPLEHRLTFGMLKRLLACEYDELMIISIDSPDAVDELWLQAAGGRPAFPRLVAETFRELAKLNPQSTVHAKTLYSATNVIRRCTPEPVFAELATRPYYLHVGDFYWRFDESHWAEGENAV